MRLNRGGLGLAGSMVPRSQPRQAEQRAEPRHGGLVDRAILVFRGQDHLVRVLNISSRGTMIESEILPRIGESVTMQFESCARLLAVVRWVRDGQIGLNFNHDVVLG
ncbi:MAG TPA: PilZ domain-containing protein [Allosphingosinicella sp.]|jgi:hypothetical protein|uniref:PilZ domain-containing protein n=1 Tax=Allosphingosinicella sp. TaxID=2823234 RepID=UPI002F2AD974